MGAPLLEVIGDGGRLLKLKTGAGVLRTALTGAAAADTPGV